MTVTINISGKDLPRALVAELGLTRKAIERAARSAALRLKAYLVKQSDALGITDTGLYKRSFVVDGTSVVNESPHGGVIELGARPHAVSREGIEALASWARRKLKIRSRSEALGVAYAIAEKIRVNGQEARYVMRDSLDVARDFFRQELGREMSRRYR